MKINPKKKKKERSTDQGRLKTFKDDRVAKDFEFNKHMKYDLIISLPYFEFLTMWVHIALLNIYKT